MIEQIEHYCYFVDSQGGPFICVVLSHLLPHLTGPGRPIVIVPPSQHNPHLGLVRDDIPTPLPNDIPIPIYSQLVLPQLIDLLTPFYSQLDSVPWLAV